MSLKLSAKISLMQNMIPELQSMNSKNQTPTRLLSEFSKFNFFFFQYPLCGRYKTDVIFLVCWVFIATSRLSCLACGISVPQPGIELISSALGGRFLTTAPPRSPKTDVNLAFQKLAHHVRRQICGHDLLQSCYQLTITEPFLWAWQRGYALTCVISFSLCNNIVMSVLASFFMQ